MSTRTHLRLDVWKESISLAEYLYQLTTTFPPEERFVLTKQIRAAAVSIPSNIAEGAARGSRADYIRFLYIARGSAAELETQTILASRLGLETDRECTLKVIRSVMRRLSRQIARLQQGR